MSHENHNDAAPGSVAPETETDPFQDLLQRVRAGNQEAARLLYEEFTVDLITTIRDRYLPQTSRLRRLLDSGDLEQEVWFRVFQLLKEVRNSQTSSISRPTSTSLPGTSTSRSTAAT